VNLCERLTSFAQQQKLLTRGALSVRLSKTLKTLLPQEERICLDLAIRDVPMATLGAPDRAPAKSAT